MDYSDFYGTDNQVLGNDAEQHPIIIVDELNEKRKDVNLFLKSYN